MQHCLTLTNLVSHHYIAFGLMPSCMNWDTKSCNAVQHKLHLRLGTLDHWKCAVRLGAACAFTDIACRVWMEASLQLMTFTHQMPRCTYYACVQTDWRDSHWEWNDIMDMFGSMAGLEARSKRSPSIKQCSINLHGQRLHIHNVTESTLGRHVSC
jgi:hypothetical protein